MKKIFFLFGFIIAFIATLPAQDIDSLMELYNEQFQQEKIHIHFDKGIYNKGETVWFKAYVMAGAGLSNYSKNLYVDWFDQGGSLLSHTVSPMFESSARGQFMVPDKYAGRILHAKAYTNWMLNFDTAFLYNRDLRVNQFAQFNDSSKPAKQVTRIHFFPEGGDLVGGIIQKVAFLATNQDGMPVSVSGSLSNSRNTLMDSFSTRHDGMGYFFIEPDAKETYTANWVDEYGTKYTSNLPVNRTAGATIQLFRLKGKMRVVVNRSEGATNNFKTLYVIAHMNQSEVYKAQVNASTKAAAAIEIPTNDLATGILQVTLFDADWIPVAERIAFVNNHQYSFEPVIKIVEKNLNKKGINRIDLSVEDSVFSNMSMSVTDAGFGNDGSNTIISQMLLAGDIKGHIHNPAYYFSGDADSIQQHLDLVMLTHGWRRFNWSAIAENRTPVIEHAKDTDYLHIKGSIDDFNKLNPAKPISSVNLILQARDSSKQYLSLPISPAGTFFQNDITFYDTIKIFYQVNENKKLKSKPAMQFQNGLTEAPTKYFDPGLTRYSTLNITDSIATARSNFFYNENLQQLAFKNLKEIILRSRVKSSTQLLNEKYATGLFTGEAREFDVVNDSLIASTNVLDYVKVRVAGLEVNKMSSQTQVIWRRKPTALFLDEVPVEAETLENISIRDIAFIKAFRPPFFGITGGGGAGGAISVYTRKGADVKHVPGEGLNFKLLAGYTSYKEFYNPDYSVDSSSETDVRSTLYWEPFILTEKNDNVYHIEFFNNDISKKLLIIVEGVNAKGKLTRIEKLLE